MEDEPEIDQDIQSVWSFIKKEIPVDFNGKIVESY